MWLMHNYFQNCHHVTQLFNLKHKGLTEMDIFTSLCFHLCLTEKYEWDWFPISSTEELLLHHKVTTECEQISFWPSFILRSRTGTKCAVNSLQLNSFWFLWKSEFDTGSRIYACYSTLYFEGCMPPLIKFLQVWITSPLVFLTREKILQFKIFFPCSENIIYIAKDLPFS